MSDRGPDGDKLNTIARAALAVFSRQGFHHATMQEVADEARVGKGTVYLYFPSKHRLLEYTFQMVMEDYLAQLHMALGGSDDFAGRLRRLFVFAVQAAHTQQDRARLMLEGSTGMSEEFKRWLLRLKQTALADIAAMVSAGVKRGELRPVDPLATAHIISGALSSLVAMTLWKPDEHMPSTGLRQSEAAGPEALANRVFEVLWGTLSPIPTPTPSDRG